MCMGYTPHTTIPKGQLSIHQPLDAPTYQGRCPLHHTVHQVYNVSGTLSHLTQSRQVFIEWNGTGWVYCGL